MDKIMSAEEKLAQHQLEEFLSFAEPPSDVYVLLKRAHEALLKKDEKIAELQNKVEQYAAQFKQDAITDLAIREGEFAEWCAIHGWVNVIFSCYWKIPDTDKTSKTSDLVQLFIDEKMKAK